MQEEKLTHSKLRLLGSRSFKAYGDMFKVVDFLNKTLKHKQIIFGLSKDEEGNMVISIYEA
ncbi:MAG: YpmA family protein [Desulfotomaculales bacterium]